MSSTPKLYRRARNHVTASLGDEMALMDVRSGDYVAFNISATMIWQMIETPMTVDDICARLMDEFEVDEPRCRASVEHALQTLRRRTLVDIVDE